MARCLKGYWAVSDRVLVVKIRGKPFDLTIIQVYTPTSEREKDEMDKFYNGFDQAIEQCKNREIAFVMGDINAEVGEGGEEDALGPFGLGERWINWCIER